MYYFIKIKKNFSIFLQLFKIQLMDRMDAALAIFIIMFGVFIEITFNIIFFQAIYLKADTIGGWDINQAYILLGTFYFVRFIGWFSYIRGFNQLSRLIENGELDLYLSKPVNLRFLLTFRHLEPLTVIPQLILAVIITTYGAIHTTSAINIPIYLLTLFCAIIIHFSLISILYTINFFFIIHQGTYLQQEITNLGQYPITIYKGFMRIFLSIIIPLAFIFSVPARALTGNLTAKEIIYTILITIIFYTLSKIFWNLGINKYESVQG